MDQKEINRLLKEIILDLHHCGKLYRTLPVEEVKEAVKLQQDYDKLITWLKSHGMLDEAHEEKIYKELEEINKLYKVK